MKRRTVLQRLGATGIATVGFAGSASADSKPNIELDRELDVASVSGRVTLDALLEDRDLEQLPADVDPTERTLVIDDSARNIRIQECCNVCCAHQLEKGCGCICCECDFEVCN